MKSSNITNFITQNSRKQLKSMKSIKVISIGVASLALAIGAAVMPAFAELDDFDRNINGDISPESTGYPLSRGGFPQWYKDKSGLKLDLCLDTLDALCIPAPLPDPTAEAVFPDNFSDEAFWWTAGAQATTVNGGFRASLVLATEAAFGNGDPAYGDQIVFNRTRIRINGGLINNRWYRITYPYGRKELQATTRDTRKPATINFTEDFGCAPSLVTICDFGSIRAAGGRNGVTNLIGKPWLTWDNFDTDLNSLDPVIGGRYVGDPNTAHTIKGSPIAVDPLVHRSGYQNFFKVEELTGRGGTVVRTIAYTDLFSVSGKVSED